MAHFPDSLWCDLILTHVIQMGLWSVLGIWGVTSSGVKVREIIQTTRGIKSDQKIEIQE